MTISPTRPDSLNAEAPIEVILFVIGAPLNVIHRNMVRDDVPWNAVDPMLSTMVAPSTVVSAEQPSNVPSLISLTASGMVISVKNLPENTSRDERDWVSSSGAFCCQRMRTN